MLPTVWFRNRWSWGYHMERPLLRQTMPGSIELDEPYYGKRYFHARDQCDLLFTENESDRSVLWQTENTSHYTKSCIGSYIVRGDRSAVNPEKRGTKASAHYAVSLEPGASAVFDCRLTDAQLIDPFGPDFGATIALRAREADEFYATVEPPDLSEDARAVMRQAFAGLLWSKQYYHYVVRDWLTGDPTPPPPPASRLLGPQPRVDPSVQRRRHFDAR